MPAPDISPLIVLDTNVVLDWLLFRDPECALLGEYLHTGGARWLASAAMRDELEHVLARGGFERWRPDLPALRATWDRLAMLRAEPPAPVPVPGARLRCSDPDDQKFIDLALAEGARWLLSRDRAVLKLARAARALGLEILPPGRWAATAATG